jgi:excinuclease ABC subunit B
MENIKSELQQHVKYLKKIGKLEEAYRLQEKTLQDLEMMRQTGYCHGIENYSRHLDFRKTGEPPYTLIDFFISKGEFLTIIDESHISVPQLRSMHRGPEINFRFGDAGQIRIGQSQKGRYNRATTPADRTT